MKLVRISVLAIGLGLIITALLITLTDSHSQQTQEIELDATNSFNNETEIQEGYLKNVVISSSNELQDESPKLPYS